MLLTNKGEQTFTINQQRALKICLHHLHWVDTDQNHFLGRHDRHKYKWGHAVVRGYDFQYCYWCWLQICVAGFLSIITDTGRSRAAEAVCLDQGLSIASAHLCLQYCHCDWFVWRPRGSRRAEKMSIKATKDRCTSIFKWKKMKLYQHQNNAFVHLAASGGEDKGVWIQYLRDTHNILLLSVEIL